MITAGLTRNYAGEYTAESFAAKTATGCAAGALAGAGCQQGATVAAVLHGLSYLGDLARADQIEGSSKGIRIVDASGKELSNTSQPSVGINRRLASISRKDSPWGLIRSGASRAGLI